MNTNRITNKNLKRLAIAAGATATALFLAAGFVATRGNDQVEILEAASPAVEVEAPAAVMPVEESTHEVAVIAPASPSINESTKKAATSTTKRSNKKATSTVGGGVVLDAPVTAEAPANSNTGDAVASAPQQTDVATSNPTTQPAVESPDAASPAAAPAAQSTEQATAASDSGTSSVSVPLYPIVDRFQSNLRTIDLTRTSPTIPSCIPGYNC
jgi:hypothetical protein